MLDTKLYKIVGITRKADGTNLHLESETDNLVLENIEDNSYFLSDTVGLIRNSFYWLPRRLDVLGISKTTLLTSSGVKLHSLENAYV